MNTWIKKIHMYTGLLNFTILCVFGIAGLVATAEAPDIFHSGTIPVVATLSFRAPGSASDQQVGELIRGRLQPPHAGKPNIRRDAQHQLVADFYSVNGLVRATLFDGDGLLRVETRRNSIWRFFDNAHATTIQESAYEWAPLAWSWYIELSIWSLMLMALSGIWLGLASRWPFWWTKASLVAGTLTFAILYWGAKVIYKFLRHVHLILGLLLFWVIMMYAISAVQMAHRIRIVPVVTESETMSTPHLDARPLANELMAKNGISGEMGNVTPGPEGYRFSLTRAGGATQITYYRSTGRTVLRASDTGFWGVMNRLHHFHGLHNQTGVRNVWGWVVLFASLGLLTLGATGIFMWFKLYQERTIGMVLLGANLVVSVGLLIALRM